MLAVALALLVTLPLARLIAGSWASKVVFVGSAVACCLALAAAITVVGTSTPAIITLWSPSPYATLALRLDPLGGAFAAIVAGSGVAASLFALGYARPRAVDNIAYPWFLLAMLAVTAAANVYTFLAAWEAMALASFMLVLGDGAAAPRRQAAIIYLTMTHVATVFVAASFFLVARASGSTSFEAMQAAPLSASMASMAFVFAVVGFGTKAGLIPLHIWLPRAHPAAPSHVSALMSAAMVKTGVYGIARVAFVFLGPGESWWGILLMIAGAVSAVLGVLYALMEHDLKRILAYSTVENVGIIAIGLGAALALRAEDELTLAAAALTAALLHATNHAWFKTLLFLGAGSIQRAAHTLNIDRLGGLARAMPLTAVAMLIGSLSIAALPPTNGFAGEWLLLRSLIGAGGAPAPGDAVRLIALASAGALALTGGLAVACFVRLFGISLLGVARTPEAAAAREPPRVMGVVLGGLAVGCVATGVAAGMVVRWLASVPGGVFALDGVEVTSAGRLDLPAGGGFSPVVIAMVLVLLAPLPWLAARLLLGRPTVSRGPVWTTGVTPRPTMQYTGTSFSKPIRLFFHRVLLPERQIDVVYHGVSPLPRLVRYSGRVPVLFEEWIYLPLRASALWAATRLRRLQGGSVQVYLLYMMLALGVLLVVAR